MIINLDADLSEQMKEIFFCHEFIELVKDIYLLEDLKHELMQPVALAVYELIKKKQVTFE